MTEKISGGAFEQMVAFGAACITREKQAINDLNVFPVPDGDTGTNMSLTIQTAAAELKSASPPRWARPPRSPPAPCCGAPAETPALSCPCCSGALQVRQGAGGDGRRTAGGGHVRGRDHGLRRRDEARRGYGADGIPSGGGQS
ncbi:MAG: hypothetical protein ACLR01_09085 [Vescimonas sp.]